MKDSLAMLTASDWETLRRQMHAVEYRRGALLLQEGLHRRALFIVRAGSVRVERLAQGRPIMLARLGPGQVLGEIGFVENTPASASVVAHETSVVDVIEGDALQSLIASEPGFGARFYHSLAIALARRTRSADLARLASASAGAAAQVNRFHVARTGHISARQIPAGLIEGLEAFERAMLAARLALRAGAPLASEAGRVGAACDAVVELLKTFTVGDALVDIGYSDLLAFRDTDTLEAGVGDCIFREIYSTFMLSATMARYHAKPRGFPDDAETLAAVYRNEPEGDDRLGPLIDAWFLGRPLCRSRRASVGAVRGLLEEMLESTAVTTNAGGTELRVASLASGVAAELFAFFEAHPAAAVAATCVDVDEDALLAGARRADLAPWGDRIAFLQGSAVPSEGEGVSLLGQDLVYALGLCEYLSDEQVVALLDFAGSLLARGGCVVVTNLAHGQPDQELMGHLLDWQTHHRTEAELRALFARSVFAGRALSVTLDAFGVTLMARCSKDG